MAQLCFKGDIPPPDPIPGRDEANMAPYLEQWSWNFELAGRASVDGHHQLDDYQQKEQSHERVALGMSSGKTDTADHLRKWTEGFDAVKDRNPKSN
ncbi:MAG: hypothetical protein M1827_006070 [Pycnora praestabilis]|nr:MAG: hypothetical protein M1827_006070 [Pycnora praestabilis]